MEPVKWGSPARFALLEREPFIQAKKKSLERELRPD